MLEYLFHVLVPYLFVFGVLRGVFTTFQVEYLDDDFQNKYEPLYFKTGLKGSTVVQRTSMALSESADGHSNHPGAIIKC